MAHKIAERCQEELGGSGSLMIRSDLKGTAAHAEPFMVGDIDPAKSFVHVLDDTTLHVLMKELDTIADFVAYLDKKEGFVRTGPAFFAPGEEELVSWYLRHMNDKQEHYFKLPAIPGIDSLRSLLSMPWRGRNTLLRPEEYLIPSALCALWRVNRESGDGCWPESWLIVS